MTLPNVPKKIIVLAGSREQFEQYLADNGLTDSDAVYGYDAAHVQGVIASKVEIIGTFHERNDARDLEALARTRIRPI